MDKMSLLSVLAVSVPEALFSIYVCFLITGEKTYLYIDDVKNIVRLSATVILMVVTSVAVRSFFPNLAWIFLVNLAIVSIILKLIYKMKWYKAILNAAIFYFFLVSIEIVYTPLFFQFTGITVDELLTSDKLRIIFSIPERAIQLFFIISLWNWNKVLFNIKEYKEVRLSFFLFMVVLLSIEAVFLFIFVNNISEISYSARWAYICGFGMFSVLNFSLFKFLNILTNAIIKKDLNDYLDSKRKTIDVLANIHSSLEKGDLEKAKYICRNQKY